jgi:hypothetical protein
VYIWTVTLSRRFNVSYVRYIGSFDVNVTTYAIYLGWGGG